MLRLRAATAIAVVPFLAACGGADDDDAPSFAAALEQLPRLGADDFAVISWTDVAAAREANGFDAVPDPAVDAAADLVVAMNGLADSSVVLAPLDGYDAVTAPAGVDNELGVGWTSADSIASVSGAGSFNFYADDGDVEVDGAEPDGDLYRLDDDGPYGAVDGNRAVIASDAEQAQAWVDDDASTLDGLADVNQVAEAIDDADALSGRIVDLGPRGILGIGWIDDDGDPACVFVYAGFPGEADDVRDDVEAGWSAVADRVELDDVRTDGDLVVVRGHQVDDVTAPLRLLMSATLPLPDAG